MRLRENFQSRIGGKNACKPLLAMLNGKPFGYIQWYLNRDIPEYGLGKIHQLQGVSLDYFIGDAEFLGQGYGSRMLTAAVNFVREYVEPEDHIFFVGHEPKNRKAINCSQKAGFTFLPGNSFQENGCCYELFSRDLRSEKLR